MKIVTDSINELKNTIHQWIQSTYPKNALEGKRIFLKPNMGYPKPAPYTTALDIIKGTVEVLLEYNPKEIIIGEGSNSKFSALDNFELNGLMKALEKYPITYIDLNEYPSTAITNEKGKKHFLPIVLTEYDVKISLPVIKFYDDDEGNTFLSNAIKNFFGLPPKEKYEKSSGSYQRDTLHDDLHASVAEIYNAVEKYSPFDLYICDGRTILHGEAEVGIPMQWGKIIVTDNAVEADLLVLDLLEKPRPKYLDLIIKK